MAKGLVDGLATSGRTALVGADPGVAVGHGQDTRDSTGRTAVTALAAAVTGWKARPFTLRRHGRQSSAHLLATRACLLVSGCGGRRQQTAVGDL